MKAEEAKAVELHEEKKLERFVEKRGVEGEKSKQNSRDERKSCDGANEIDGKNSGRAGRDNSLKHKEKKNGEKEADVRKERSLSEENKVKTKRSTRLTKSCSVQVIGESKSKSKYKQVPIQTKCVKVFHGLKIYS